jgi:hypothetical protein
VLHERAAARLAPGEGAQLAVEGGHVGVDLSDHGEGHVDLAASRGGQVELRQALLRVDAGEPARAAYALMEEDRVDALEPRRALVDQRVAQAHLTAQLGDVRRRDPRLRQASVGEELAQVAGVEAVGLRAALRAAQGARVGQLGQVGLRADALKLLAHEPPAGGGFERRPDLLTREVGEEVPQGGPIGRSDAAGLDLTRLLVERIEGDLGAVDVEADGEGHGCSFSRGAGAAIVRFRSDGYSHMPSFPSGIVTLRYQSVIVWRGSGAVSVRA